MTLFAAALSWLFAVAVTATGLPPLIALPAALAAGALLPARSVRYRAMHLFAALIVCLIAVDRLSPGSTSPDQPGIGAEPGTTVRLLTRVESDGDRYPSSTLATVSALAVDRSGEWAPANGRIQLTLTPSADLREADEVALFGRLEPAGGTSASDGYGAYLARRGVVASMSFPTVALVERRSHGGIASAWRSTRERLQECLSSLLGARLGTFASTLLFGNDHALPADLRRDLARTGASHLVAITAFNLVLLYGTLISILAPFAGRRRAVLFAAAGAVLYGFSSGQSAAVWRGESIIVLLSLAAVSGRPYSRPALLILAAAGITALQPAIVGDASFQLTFSAAAGISLLAPPIARLVERVEERLMGDRRPPAIATAMLDAGLISVAVTLATLPVSVATFGTVNPYAPLVNAVLNPFVPLLTLLALVTAIGGIVAPAFGVIVAAPLWLLLYAVTSIVHLVAGWPDAAISISLPGLAFAICWYGALLGVRWIAPAVGRRISMETARWQIAGRRPHYTRRRVRPGYATLGLAALILAVPSVSAVRAATTSPPAASATWLDLGGGQALIVRGENGLHLLVLSEGTQTGGGLAQRLETIGTLRVDAVIVLRPLSERDVQTVTTAARQLLRARAIFYPSPEPGGGGAVSAARGDAIGVTGSVTISLGGTSSLALLTNGAGEAIASVHLSDRTLVIGAISAASRLLERWQEPLQFDVLAAETSSTERTLSSLQALRPAVIVLPGHRSELNTAAVAGASDARVIDPSQVRDLRLQAIGGRLSLSYRDRRR